ncbi:hypothetical protein FA15DRAFT_624476 [Coprinopsis marcescibilis]|uniref:DUF6533 domain-containing protein n=1 Tax=Coprinopsis marcescibilis TaxID=230819 RepID=A0A5C3KYQ0_COPMA|nr:hypothetical protein FA15DRAFT_624476 [Coprinopsis marcescibilis]
MASITAQAYIAFTRLSTFNAYFTVLSSTLYICDYFETLRLEFKYMWTGKWNAARILFFISRYIVILQIPLFVHFPYEPLLLPSGCYVLQASLFVSSFIGEACPLALLVLCLYALFGAKRKHAPLFVTGYFLLVSFRFITVVVVLLNMKANDYKYRPSRCSLSTKELGADFIHANRILKIVGQAILLGLTCWIGYKRSLVVKTPLVSVLWRGGAQYFGGICLMNALDLAAHYLRPIIGYFSIVNYLLRVALPILANRLLLQMYDQSSRNDLEKSEGKSITGLRFASRFAEMPPDNHSQETIESATNFPNDMASHRDHSKA